MQFIAEMVLMVLMETAVRAEMVHETMAPTRLTCTVERGVVPEPEQVEVIPI